MFYQIWRHSLEKIFPNLIAFDTKENYFKYRKKQIEQKPPKTHRTTKT